MSLNMARVSNNNEMSVCSVIKHTLRDVTARVRLAYRDSQSEESCL